MAYREHIDRRPRTVAKASSYRPEIDGLRGLSVAIVMAFHAQIPGMRWGYVGVDIFFVISGYLITRLIITEQAGGQFSFLHFYERRARRLLPALFVMLALCTPVALYVLTPGPLHDYGRTMSAAALFSANLLFSSQFFSYFAPHGDGEALIHLWSLAVEEQYYLLFPLLAIGIARWRAAAAWPAILFAAAASILWKYHLATITESAGFYDLPARMWELLAGAAVATLPAVLVQLIDRWQPLRHGAILLALALMAAPPFVMIASSALLPLPVVIGAALLIAAIRDGDWLARALSAGPLLSLGLISYSAYLWHQPALVFARSLLLRPLDIGEALAVLALATGLAWVSWRWIETPGRRHDLPRRRVFAFALFGSVSVLIGGLAVSNHAYAPANASPAERALARLYSDGIDRTMACRYRDQPDARPCVHGTAGSMRIALLGDSHAAAIAPGMEPMLRAGGIRALEYSSPGCPPLLAAPGLPDIYAHCARAYDRASEEIIANEEVRVVLFAARWAFHLEGSPFDNGQPGGAEPGHPDYSTPLDPDIARTAIAALAQRFTDAGIRVILIYPVPEAGWDVPVRMAKQRTLPWLTPSSPRIPADRVAQRTARARHMLDRITGAAIERIDPQALFCDSRPDGWCRQADGERPYYYDDDHLSPYGAALLLSSHEALLRRAAQIDSR